MRSFIDVFASHNILLTPAGIWKLDSDGRKEAIDAKRVDYLDWDEPKYSKDNMGRHFIDNSADLANGLLVLDIDGADTIFNNDDTITVVDLDITIPFGLFTTTTAQNKFHFYYRGETEDIANRIKGVHGTTIDIFTHGTVFEGHTFSPHNQLHDGEVLQIPNDLYNSIVDHQMSHNVHVSKDNTGLGLSSNIQRFNLVKQYLSEEGLETEKQKNAFFMSVFPAESHNAKKRKKNIVQYPLSYDLFNKIAVKLTTTKELDFNEHVLPTLHNLLREWEIDPKSRKSQKFLWGNILPSLPQHESVLPYSREQDVLTFQEHLNAQGGTDHPLFYTTYNGRLMYIEIDKITQEPVKHAGGFLFEEAVAKRFHPELNEEREDGKIVKWNSQGIPYVECINDPYRPPYELDYKRFRHTINLYTPTEYIKQVMDKASIPEDNLIMKAVTSTIGPKWLELYLAYSSQIVFGNVSPTMVLWMSALKTEMGGSGKSVVTLELFSLLLGSAASAVDAKTVSSGWGDIVTSTKVLSLEDMPELSKEWDNVYANIKQQNTNSHRKLNMKGAGVTSERVDVTMTGSTNFRLRLSPSDRRFLCLEPAHFHGLTEPLSLDEQISFSKLLSSRDYREETQDYANYLFHIYNKGFSEEIKRALFIAAPETEFRSKWVGGGESNTQNLLLNISRPRDLLDMLKFDREDNIAALNIAELLEVMVISYVYKTSKSAVSWRWFEDMLPYVMADKYQEQMYSKATISKMLHVDMINYSDIHEKQVKDSHLPSRIKAWPKQGRQFYMNDDIYKDYIEVITELKSV